MTDLQILLLVGVFTFIGFVVGYFAGLYSKWLTRP